MNRDNFDRQLDRIKSHILSKSGTSKTTPMPSRYSRMADELGGELIAAHGGSFCCIRRCYPFGFSFGDTVLRRPDQSRRIPLASFSVTEDEGEAAPESLLFFDIETTGLGGTGTVPFLIGCGSVTSDGFEIRQYLLPDYPDEAAMLEHLLTELTSRRRIVSYNGTAFDLNIIRDRIIINRVAREIQTEGHIDLLYAVRRLFKRRLGDCSLGNVEREIFRFHRSDDIPGYLVPSVYFDWLASEDLTSMAVVLEHNRQDILSLWFLLTHIVEIFSSEGTTLNHVEDIYSLSRIYGRRRRNDKVVGIYRRLERPGRSILDEEMLLYHSFAFKRSGDWREAVKLWEKLADCQSREGFVANLELAKYFEHREKILPRAHHHACLAEKTCPETGSHRALLEQRLSRLRSRLRSRQ
jgi:uncharacterized protein YprB with RNaseH-like and TPR domain